MIFVWWIFFFIEKMSHTEMRTTTRVFEDLAPSLWLARKAFITCLHQLSFCLCARHGRHLNDCTYRLSWLRNPWQTSTRLAKNCDSIFSRGKDEVRRWVTEDHGTDRVVHVWQHARTLTHTHTHVQPSSFVFPSRHKSDARHCWVCWGKFLLHHRY